jgi:hypothetical protein
VAIARAAGSAAALLATLLLAVVALVLFRDPLVNSQPVRDELIAQLRKFTGRDVSLAGDIEIDDFPWITVVVVPGSFANPIGFTGPPLFTWRQIRLAHCISARCTRRRRVSTASPSMAWLPSCVAMPPGVTTGATSVRSSRLGRQRHCWRSR